jgi:undecaprenyl diphosphate synthase
LTTALRLNHLKSADHVQHMLAQALTAESGEVDILIRTGGEQRLSDFLLWECAYAELLFTDRMWPDFDAADLDAALAEFRRRERRFGAVPATLLSAAGAKDPHLRNSIEPAILIETPCPTPCANSM